MQKSLWGLWLTLLLAGCASKQEVGRDVASMNQNDLLGATLIKNGRDFEPVPVDGRRITAIKVCAKKDDLALERVEVTFGNGTSEQVHMKSFIQQGTCTGWRDLEGKVRNVTMVRIWGSSNWDPRGRQTRVEIYGRGDVDGDPRDLIGSTFVSNGRDFDPVQVNGRHITALKICAKGDDLELDRVEVTFGNGMSEQVRMKYFVRKGTCTGWADLPGHVRNVNMVRIWGSSDWDPRGRQTRVEIYGKGGFDADPKDLIGSTLVSNGRDFDPVRVDGRQITALKICAKGDDLELDRVEATFGNGMTEQVRMKYFVRQGTCTGWVDLPGQVRNVNMLRIWGSSDWDPRGRQTRVEIYGKAAVDADPKDLIGSTLISNGRDFDPVRVNGRRITSMKICARGDDLGLDRVEVVFGNGKSEQLRMKSFIQKGTCTGWKDLPGQVRNVNTVLIWAASDWDPRGRQTRVDIYGK